MVGSSGRRYGSRGAARAIHRRFIGVGQGCALTIHSSRTRFVTWLKCVVVPLQQLTDSYVAGRLNSGVRALTIDSLICQLRVARTGLIRTYVLHVVWFVTMCAFAGLQWNQHGLKATVLLTLVTVPPVLFYTIRVHKLCRAIDPRARTVGLVPVVITTIVLSPFESGLVLPAKNLLAANRILRPVPAETLPNVAEGPNNSFKPKPLRGSA